MFDVCKKKTFIYHPAYADSTKTFTFFDIIHLINNTRNNLLNQKKFVFPFPEFVFPSFQYDFVHLLYIDVPEGFISWRIFHEVYERDGQTLWPFQESIQNNVPSNAPWKQQIKCLISFTSIS